MADAGLSSCCNGATGNPGRFAPGPASFAGDPTVKLNRAAIAAILLFGLVDLIFGSSHEPVLSPALRTLQGANLALVGLTLGLTWLAIYRRHWRLINIAVCATVVASEAAIGLGSGEAVVFSVAIIVLLAAPAMLGQWSLGSRVSSAELIAAREEAETAARSKSDFISQMSHEIRTPMNAILGMADLLDETDLSNEQHKYLSIMMNNGAALLELIDDILDFARIDGGRLTLEAISFDPVELAERVAETLAIRAHQKGLELTVRVAPDMPSKMLGDPLRLRQILMNLVANAIKFTARGHVALAIDCATEGGGGELHFAVSDTGIGIAADQREKIFTRFTQASTATARKYGGAGLGLAIVKQLVDLMGGRIWVDSDLGKGSTFHFAARFEVAPDQDAAAAPTPMPELAGKRVLIADQTAVARLALAEALAGTGAQVTQADSGEQAIDELRRADEEGAPYRIVLLDCRMAAAGSGDSIRRICEGAHGAGMVIAMLTSDDLNVKMPLLRKIGLVHHIIKPARRAELFRVIRTMMGYGEDAPQSANDAASEIPAAENLSAAIETLATPGADTRPIHTVDITSIEPVEQIGSPREALQPPLTGRPLRILVADDSADNRLLIQAFLKQIVCDVEHAENGEIALQKFVVGTFDVVLMDIQMPVMDGYMAAKLIRQWEQTNNASRTPIIALTASVLDEAVHMSFDAGCDTHVSKPVRRPTLLAAIREVTEKPAAERSLPTGGAGDPATHPAPASGAQSKPRYRSASTARMN
jgi:signal transduction histidine kinase/DNA-binding response OmpR family regulator